MRRGRQHVVAGVVRDAQCLQEPLSLTVHAPPPAGRADRQHPNREHGAHTHQMLGFAQVLVGDAEDHRQPSGVQPDQSGAGGAVQGGGEDGTDEQQPDQHLAVDGQGVGGGGDRDYPYRDNQYRRRCDRLGHRCPDVGVGPKEPGNCLRARRRGLWPLQTLADRS